MPFRVLDQVGETSSNTPASSGTITVNLSGTGATVGSRTMRGFVAAGYATNDTCPVHVFETATPSRWCTVIATVTDSAPDTLTFTATSIIDGSAGSGVSPTWAGTVTAMVEPIGDRAQRMERAFAGIQPGGRLTVSTGNPVPIESSVAPNSTDTTADTVTYTTDPGWTTGALCTPNSTGGGLTAGTVYYLNRVSAGVFSFHTTLANAEAGTSKIDLTASITATIQVYGYQSSTMRFAPFCGGWLPLFADTAGTVPAPLLLASEISLALGTLVSGTNYDFFVYNNAGTATLEKLAWSSDSARATALQKINGVDYKSGDATRLWVGSGRAISTAAIEDSAGGIITQVGAKRLVYPAFNRVPRAMNLTSASVSWSYTSAGPRLANGATAPTNCHEFLAGAVVDPFTCEVFAWTQVTSNSARAALMGVGFNSSSAFAAKCRQNRAYNTSASIMQMSVAASLKDLPTLGYNYLAWLESGGDGSCAFNGNNEGGMTAVVFA